MKQILLIEDDTLVRENTAEILKLAHYNVTTAAEGKTGVRLATKIHPDLVLCDILMPELDGYGVLHILSKNPETASIPFIFLTAKTEKTDIRKGMGLGADDYLTKPFEETDLLNAVETRLRKGEFLKKKNYYRNINGLNQFFDEIQDFKGLDKLSKDRISVRYKKKEIIFHEGDTPTHLFFLNRGRIKGYKSNNEGKEYMTNLYKKEDFFGVVPLLKNTNYAETAVALENSDIYKIPKQDFISLIYKRRDVASKFIRILSNHIIENEKKLLSLAYDTVRKKVSNALLLLEGHHQTALHEKEIRIKMGRDDLASLAGTATETVIRCLSEFKDEGLIQINGRDILILDTKKLKDIR